MGRGGCDGAAIISIRVTSIFGVVSLQSSDKQLYKMQGNVNRF